MDRKTRCALFLPVILLLATGLAGAEKNWKDASVKIGDIKVHYLEAGTGERHLVFIPGLAMTAESWKEQIPYFAVRNFHVIAMDPRSQGLTTSTEEGNTYEQHAADLKEFLKKLDIEHCTLVGMSAAVLTILEYVASPESMRPDAVVFLNGDAGGQPVDDYPGGITLAQARTTLLAIEEDRAKAAEAAVRAMFVSPPPEALVVELTNGSMKTSTGALISLLFDRVTGDRRTSLASVNIPALIVMSQSRQLTGEYLKSKITEADLKVVPDAGPALMLEKPQSFNQALEEFLGKQ